MRLCTVDTHFNRNRACFTELLILFLSPFLRAGIAFGGACDWLDGYLARRWNQQVRKRNEMET